MTNSKRGSGDKFDAQMDESLYLAFKAYAQAVDAARALSDRLLTEGRAEDANAVFGLIIASWKLTDMHGDVLKLTRTKMGSDLQRTEQRVHDGLQALKRPGFVLTTEHVYKELRAKDNKARVKKARFSVTQQTKAKKPRKSPFDGWIHEIAAAEASKGAKASAARALKKIEDKALELQHDGELPEERTVLNWIKREQSKTSRDGN